MKILMASVLMCLSLSAWAQKKLVLINEIDGEPWFNTLTAPIKDYTFRGRLERIFRKGFGNSGYELEVYHFPGVFKIAQLLQDENNLAIFFTGHMDGRNQQAIGVSVDKAILTADKINIKPLFTKPSKRIKFIAFCGCRSQYLIDDLKKQHWDSNNYKFETIGFTTEINVKTALRQAIIKFKSLPTQLEESQRPSERPYIETKITRRFHAQDSKKKRPAIMVLNRDELIGTFAEQTTTDPQIIYVKIPFPEKGKLTSKSDLKLVFKSGMFATGVTNIDVGEFNISYAGQNMWEKFPLSNDILYSIYHYVGEILPPSDPQD